jgi:bacterioferritin
MSDDALRTLIAGLNEDLAFEFQAVIFYTVGAQLMTGANRPELKAMFEGEIPDEQGHASFLAQKIVALGGTPVTKPEPVELGSSNRERIELALQAEKDTLRRYSKRVEQADAAGEVGLRLSLEDIIVDETGHREELEMILREFED